MISNFEQEKPPSRRLLNGQDVTERAAAAQIVLRTRCPAKWAFVDLEEGIVWEHDGTAFKRRPFSSDCERQRLLQAVQSLSNKTFNG